MRHDDDQPEKTSEREELLRLASVAAHQLKSPLSSVQTVLASVLGGFSGPLDPRQRWLLEKALERCSKGTRLVNDLIRLRAVDQLDYETLGPVNLASSFRVAVDAVRDSATEKALELESEIDLPNADLAWINGESALVREILGVLLDNAVKYTPSQGRVSARLRIEPVDEEDEVPRLCVEVTDTGIGIPSDSYEGLFEEFYRAPNAKQMATEGTGLGLAFARRAAERLGGTVRLEPAPTGGVRALAGFPQRLDYAGRMGATSADASTDRASTRPISRRVVIVGGVTAGSKAAARIMRLDADADVTIVERGRFLAYSGCGLPYYISGAVTEQRMLLETPLGAVRDPAFFHNLKNVRALDSTEVVQIDRDRRTVRVRNLVDRGERELNYDRLILAMGARPVVPDLPGVDLDGIHTLHGVGDAEAIRARLGRSRVQDVVIVGAGLLGCQITESLSERGTRITLLEEKSSILRMLDEEMSRLARRHLESHGVRILCETRVKQFEGDEHVEAVVLDDGSRVACDFALICLGRAPEVRLATEAGLELGPTGAIRVDSMLRTSDPEIYAAGDCVEQVHAVTGEPLWLPGAVPASLQGRVVANNVCGGSEPFPPITGTSIVKLFDWTLASTGLTEHQARSAGFDPISVLVPGPDRSHFIPTARNLLLKLVADRGTNRVLGAQGLGEGEVAKRIDVIATALSAGLDLDRLAHLTLAYAPPYSMPLDNVITAANVLRNKRDGRFDGISPTELHQEMRAEEPPWILDVRLIEEYGRDRLRGSHHIPLGSLRPRLDELPRDRPIVLVCSLGLRSYEASRILTAHGFDQVRVLDGGMEAWPYFVEQLV